MLRCSRGVPSAVPWDSRGGVQTGLKLSLLALGPLYGEYLVEILENTSLS